MHLFWVGLIVFTAMLITDVCWVFAVNGIKDSRPFLAASWSGFLMFTSGIVTFNYTHEVWMLIPTCAGSFAGTYLGVKLDARRKKRTDII